jgi:hypothetical protein
MAVNKYPTGIKTPKREEKNGGAFFLNLDTVEAWINALPRGSAGKTAQQLYSGLQEINKIKLECEDRVDYLELIREPLFYSMSIMEKHFVGENFPLSKKQKKIANLSREFCRLMMTGYVIAIEELLEDYKERKDKELLGQLIHRGISFLNHYLLISYQTYMVIPDDIWGNIHKLYYFSETNKVNNIKIKDEKFQYIKATTISEEYMRGILLATASPYHMRSNDIANVFINIERWIDSLKIFKSSENTKYKNIFIIDITSGMPIVYGDALKGRRKNNLRIIAIDKLVNEIIHELQNGEIIASQTLISANLGDKTLSHELIKQLQHFWFSEPTYVINNEKEKQRIKMTIGISATHALAKNTLNVSNDADLFRNLADFENMEVKNTRMNGKERKNGNIKSLLLQKTVAREEEWVLLSEKRGEFCLQNTGSCIQQLQVGEVVGIKYLDQKRKDVFILGVISWMRIYSDELIKIGIKLVSASAIPIEVRPVSDTAAANQSQRAFLLPVRKELGQLSSLFGLPSTFRGGSAVVISIYSKEVAVRLTTKLTSSGLYSQYQFEAYVKQAKRQLSNKQIRITKPGNSGGFDDIWDSI